MTEMLQKTENVAKNVANENSQDLTEQWKKGEFIICNAGKCQYYYVQNEEQKEVIKTEYCLFDDNTPNWQILAPVPSYDEWKSADNCMLENEVLRLKNAKLKELLKECLPYVWHTTTYNEKQQEIKIGLYNKINEVLK